MRGDVLLIVTSLEMPLSERVHPPYPDSRLTDIIEPTGSRKHALFTKQDLTLRPSDSLLAKSLTDRMSIGRPRSQTLWPDLTCEQWHKHLSHQSSHNKVCSTTLTDNSWHFGNGFLPSFRSARLWQNYICAKRDLDLFSLLTVLNYHYYYVWSTVWTFSLFWSTFRLAYENIAGVHFRCDLSDNRPILTPRVLYYFAFNLLLWFLIGTKNKKNILV